VISGEDEFGFSVAYDGFLLAITSNIHEYFSGTVLVYECPTLDSCTLKDFMSRWGENFGNTLEFGKDSTLFVGVPDAGRVYVFDCSGAGACIEADTLSGIGYGYFYDSFGLALSFHGTTLVVGSDDTFFPHWDRRSVYLFECPTAYTCTQVERLGVEGYSGSTFFGYSVSLSPYLLIIGSPLDNTPGQDHGNVYFRHLTPTTESPSTLPPTTEPPTTEPPTTGPPTTHPPPFCPSQTYGNAYWPATEEGSSSSGSCISGFSGSPLRSCLEGGQWSSLITRGCERTKCPAESTMSTNWPPTFVSVWTYGNCRVGYVGRPYRQCLSDGTWGPVEDPCAAETIQCSAQTFGNADWPATNGGSLAQGVCVSGYSGNPFRNCRPGGSWETLVINHCTSWLFFPPLSLRCIPFSNHVFFLFFFFFLKETAALRKTLPTPSGLEPTP